MVKGRILANKLSGARKASAAKASPVRKEKGRRERRAEQTRVKLFRCALRLIAKRGMINVTVEEITEAADVGKGTFFNYFQSKEHVLGVMAEIQLGKVREAAEKGGQGKRPIQAVLHRMMLRLAEEPGRNPRMARAFISSFHASRDVRTLVLGHMKIGRKAIAGLVAIGQQRGEIDRKLNKDLVAIHLFQVFMGTVLLWSIEEKPALRTLVMRSFDQFWRSVAATGKGKKR
jgi:AcrR family transcriptional regulator